MNTMIALFVCLAAALTVTQAGPVLPLRPAYAYGAALRAAAAAYSPYVAPYAASPYAASPYAAAPYPAAPAPFSPAVAPVAADYYSFAALNALANPGYGYSYGYGYPFVGAYAAGYPFVKK